MAFSKAPTLDTYSSDRVSLFREIALRDGGLSGKDEDYLNVFSELVKQTKAGDQRKFLLKRSGTTEIIPSVAASNVRGMHFWTDLNKLVYAVGNSVYVYNFTTSTSTTLAGVFSTTSGTVGFTEFLYDDGSVKMVASDGTATSGIITIDTSNTVVTCTDVDLPTHDPNIIFLDGYLFVVKDDSSIIYNSVNNDPLSWTVDAIIAPEQEPDKVIRLAKLNNYLLAFGTTSIEYYWDAANAAPNSPMQRNDSPIKINTYLGGFAQYGNTIYYIGADSNGQPDVFTLKDFKLDSIGSPSVSRYLNTVSDAISSWTGNIVSFQGHVFYVLNAGSSKTWVIDLETNLLTRFAYKTQSTFPILGSTTLFNNSNTRTLFTLNDGHSSIHSFNETLYQDEGTDFLCKITTEGNDFGTMNRKSMKRLSIIGDRPDSNTSMTVQWSDNDHQSYNTGTSVNLNQDLPAVYQLGNFRQRIFKFSYIGNYPLRIQDIEVDINKGAS
jgi:Phage stabilisation protein